MGELIPFPRRCLCSGPHVCGGNAEAVTPFAGVSLGATDDLEHIGPITVQVLTATASGAGLAFRLRPE